MGMVMMGNRRRKKKKSPKQTKAKKPVVEADQLKLRIPEEQERIPKRNRKRSRK